MLLISKAARIWSLRPVPKLTSCVSRVSLALRQLTGYRWKSLLWKLLTKSLLWTHIKGCLWCHTKGSPETTNNSDKTIVPGEERRQSNRGVHNLSVSSTCSFEEKLNGMLSKKQIKCTYYFILNVKCLTPQTIHPYLAFPVRRWRLYTHQYAKINPDSTLTTEEEPTDFPQLLPLNSLLAELIKTGKTKHYLM